MKEYSVIRTHFSPYHGPQFEQIERDRLTKIPGISFDSRKGPFVLITNTHTELKSLPREILANTKLILHSNSGYDHYAHEVEYWKDIPVVVGHEIRAQAVAEYAIGALFEGLIEMPQHLAWNKSRTWDRPLIRDQKVRVYGFGHVGKIVVNTLKALGANVTVVDPYVLPQPKTDHSDDRVVIVCASLNDNSRLMFDEKFFEQAHPDLIFINPARGKLVKESALREFLLSHPKAQAFLDVFEKEPFDESWHHFPQVWKTSHIAGVYSELDEGIIKFEERVLADFVKMDEMSFKEKYRLELLQNKWIKGSLI